jgi:hypothetical protein
MGTDLAKYVDRGKFDQYSARPASNCRLAITLGSLITPVKLGDQARDQLMQYNMQLYLKLLNYPSVVQAGFLLHSHKLHHMEGFQNSLSNYISHRVASNWRQAAVIAIHPANSVSIAGKPAIIPSAICIEC